MEYIKCAAIKYKLKGSDKFEYVTGPNHGWCINGFSCMDIRCEDRDMSTEEQGFMTTTGRFVDRVEALEIALKAGQVNKNYGRPYLISEYLDYSVIPNN